MILHLKKLKKCMLPNIICFCHDLDCMFERKTPQPVLVEVKHKRKEIGFVRFDVFAAVFNFFSNVTLSLDFMLLHLILKIRQSKINSRSVAGRMGQMNRRPSV